MSESKPHINPGVRREQILRECGADARRVADRLMSLEEQFESVLSLAEHLFQMIPQEVWRENGAEWMGQYEGDHHAERVLEQLRAWRGSNPASSPATCEKCGQARYRHIPIETVVQGEVERKGWKCETCRWWNWLDTSSPATEGDGAPTVYGPPDSPSVLGSSIDATAETGWTGAPDPASEPRDV